MPGPQSGLISQPIKHNQLISLLPPTTPHHAGTTQAQSLSTATLSPATAASTWPPSSPAAASTEEDGPSKQSKHGQSDLTQPLLNSCQSSTDGCCHLLGLLQCLAMSTAQKVSDLPSSLQKIVGAFQMVSRPCHAGGSTAAYACAPLGAVCPCAHPQPVVLGLHP